ncbi:hypothetical protein AB4163_19925 [Vibrio splendidus]
MKTVEQIKETIFEEVEIALNPISILDHNKLVVSYLCIGFGTKEASDMVSGSTFTVAKRMLTKHRKMIDTFREKITGMYIESGIVQDDPKNGVYLDKAIASELLINSYTKEDITTRLDKVRPLVIDQMFAALESGEEKATTVISIYNQLSKMTGKEVELEEEVTEEGVKPEHKPYKFSDYKLEELDINDL